MTSKHIDAAREALSETVGLDVVGSFIEERTPDSGLLELSFQCSQRGYQGWRWVVSFTDSDKRKRPLLAEINLVASGDALLAPPWVPWSERLAEFRRQLKAEGKALTDAEADDLIAGMMSFAADDEESDDSKQESGGRDRDAVKQPPKVRVRQRRIKRAEDNQDQQPDSASQGEN